MSRESLSRFTICHSTAGRLRVKAPTVRTGMLNAQTLERFLAGRAGIESAEVRANTGSIIVRYDEELTRAEAIVEALSEVMDHPSDLRRDARKGAGPRARNLSRSEDQGSLFGLLKVLALTGFIAYYLFRTLLLKSPISTKWISLGHSCG